MATGVGSMPGHDPDEAARIVAGELPDFPHVPELPARGPGADLVGRTAVMLVDLHVDLQPAGWRLVDRPGRDERRGGSFLSADLDAIEEALAGSTAPVKAALAGPWTLAASLELPRGGRALRDPGAVRDLAASLAEAVTEHVRTLTRRLPGRPLVVQLDEPLLPTVLAGAVSTESGLGRFAAVGGPEARDGLAVAIEAAHAAGAAVLVHCCADDVPVGLVRAAGADGLSLDLARLGDRALDPLGEALDAGLVLLAGVVPTSGPYDARAAALAVRRLWSRLGLDTDQLAQRVSLSPACGLAARSPDDLRAAYAAVREAAARVVEEPVG